MIIKESIFIKSSTEVSSCPPSKFPEYAFTGRSNVGKSSLINMLTGKKSLAKTSGTPGKTQLINHFLINGKWFLVDLPGYGYARVSKTKKRHWNPLIRKYILGRKNLICLFLLIDSRHKMQNNDREFTKWLGKNKIPFAIVFTKTDKLSKTQLDQKLNSYKSELLKDWEHLPEFFISSVVDKTGRDEILSFIESTNEIIK